MVGTDADGRRFENFESRHSFLVHLFAGRDGFDDEWLEGDLTKLSVFKVLLSHGQLGGTAEGGH